MSTKNVDIYNGYTSQCPTSEMIWRSSRFVRQFKKTQLCKHHMANACKYGEACDFAHSPDEISYRPNLWKTKLCVKYSRGLCFEGPNCGFAHGQKELRSTNMFFKSSLCDDFTRHGHCHHGDRCRYAHSIQELKETPGVPGTMGALEKPSSPTAVSIHLSARTATTKKTSLTMSPSQWLSARQLRSSTVSSALSTTASSTCSSSSSSTRGHDLTSSNSPMTLEVSSEHGPPPGALPSNIFFGAKLPSIEVAPWTGPSLEELRPADADINSFFLSTDWGLNGTQTPPTAATTPSSSQEQCFAGEFPYIKFSL